MTLVVNQNPSVQSSNLVGGFFARVAPYITVIDAPKTIDTSDRPFSVIRLRNRLETVVAEIAKIEKIIKENNFLPVENGPRVYQQNLYSLYLEKDRLRMALAGYRLLMDPNFLSLTRDDQNLPLFMVLNVDRSDGFGISVTLDSFRHSSYVNFSPSLPKVITDELERAIGGLRTTIGSFMMVTNSIHGDYQGIMPPESKEVIRKARLSRLFSHIYIVAEAPKWEIDTVVQVRTDPLIIGVNPLGDIYFLGQYNPTEPELMVTQKYIFPVT
jgi:hypothetical protein